MRHHVDAVMVDALVDRLSTETGDSETAATLYQQLIPESLQGEFQTASAVQFIVDAATANFPWELLTAPSGGGREALSESGAVMRQFAESDDRRVNPTRSTSQRALLVAAGKVPGGLELPEVFAEVDAVAELLQSALGDERVDMLDDRTVELDLVQLQNKLFGDHQILHIASHGIYQPDDPTRTGAILSSTGMLTVNLVRQLPLVPDVVFLNCCSLGRIGMNRMAAGLAREFMAIGVRALVAAAWAVNDAAAKAFAETFYTHSPVVGRSVTPSPGRGWRAPRRAPARRGPRTSATATPASWCAGTGPRSTSPVRTRSSDTDLVARLDTLAVRTGDLGLAGRGPVSDGHARLSAVWKALRDWSRNVRARPTRTVCRRLGAIARDPRQLPCRRRPLRSAGGRTR